MAFNPFFLIGNDLCLIVQLGRKVRLNKGCLRFVIRDAFISRVVRLETSVRIQEISIVNQQLDSWMDAVILGTNGNELYPRRHCRGLNIKWLLLLQVEQLDHTNPIAGRIICGMCPAVYVHCRQTPRRVFGIAPILEPLES